MDPAILPSQLEMFGVVMAQEEDVTIPSIRKAFQQFPLGELASMSQVATLLRLVIVTPPTDAVSERSASALRRVKTYLRSTMTQKHLNNLLVLHRHKDKTDNIPLNKCFQEFVDARPRRGDIFRKFVREGPCRRAV